MSLRSERSARNLHHQLVQRTLEVPALGLKVRGMTLRDLRGITAVPTSAHQTNRADWSQTIE